MKCGLHVENIARDYAKVPINACSEVQLYEPIKASNELQQNDSLDFGRGTDVLPSTLHALVQQCISRKNLHEARKVHTLLTGIGYESNAHLGSYLIRMFLSCDSLSEANVVFSKIYTPNVYAWSEILLANIKDGQSEEAIRMFYQMSLTCVKPDKCVYVAVLKACVRAKALNEGRQVHHDIVTSGLERNVYLTSALVDMYGKCKSLRDACEVFRHMPSDDIVVWNAMIAGFASHGHCSGALQLVEQMQQDGLQPNHRTWTAILAGYSQKGHDKDASQLFQQMSYEGLEPNIVTWNALISGLVFNGQSYEALNMYAQMIHEGCKPDKVTYMTVLKACANVADVRRGMLIHEQMMNDKEPTVAVETTLIDMYAKGACLLDAQNLFERLSNRDVVVYNSLIAGYVLHGFLLDALLLFLRMQKEGVMLDTTTLLSILKICSLVAASICGKLIHSIVIEDGADGSEFVSTSLMDMYVECGSFKDARKVFDMMSKVDITSWNALIAAYAICSDYPSVYQTLEQMQNNGLNPDSVTFVSLLCACSFTGAIADGSYLFNLMRERYGISPTNEHFGCMVDLLGNAGCLIEAEDILCAMPGKPKVVPWTSLLNSCRVYSNVELAEHCFEQIMEIDECCSSAFVLMSNIYTTAGMAKNMGKLKAMQQHVNAWKKPGLCYIELDGVLHGFVVADDIHPQSNAIHEKLAALATQIKLVGHVAFLS